MIDWDLACLIGSLASGSPSADGLKPAMLEQVCDQSLAAVVEYTGLSPAGRIPTPESVSRSEWISANAQSMGRMLDPLLESADSANLGGLQLLGSAAVTVEAGAVLGLLSRKVLGQYDLSLVTAADDPPPRLLFVGPNVGQISAGLGESGADFVRWVAVHEVTHAVQFGAVDWLRAHIGGLASELISSFETPSQASRPNASAIFSGVATRAARFASSRDPQMIILSDRQFELVKSINAVMSVVEGHAEHVMDMACPDQIPSLPKLRNSMSKRRSSQGPLWKVISKILGMDMKMRQYQLGREFCDHVVGDAGMSALNQVWTEPAALPDTSELSDPEMWLRRVAA
jgi:coenzyme F420 biosynthesis associated uncharacterized protein